MAHKFDLEENMVLQVLGGSGDLVIHGSEQPGIKLQAEEDHFSLQEEEGHMVLRLQGDAQLHLPQSTILSVRELDGDLHVRGLSGRLETIQADGDVLLEQVGPVYLSNVDGDVVVTRAGPVRAEGYLDDDVVLRQVQQVELEEVGGDLVVRGAASLSADRAGDDVKAEEIAGPLRLQEVRGDVVLRDVAGAVEIGRVRGDLTGRNLHGDVLITRVDGDIMLNTAFYEGRVYRLAGRRKIVARLSEESPARFIIQAPHWEYPPENLQVESEQEGRIVLCLGENGPDVHLAASGEVVLSLGAEAWERTVEDLGQRMEQWGAEFGQRMERWGEQMRRQMEQVDWEQVGQEIEKATARVSRLVETRLGEIDVDRLAERANTAAEQVEVKVGEVDWERISEQVDRAVQEGMRQAHIGLEKLQERLRKREERGERLQEKAAERAERAQERVERLREKATERAQERAGGHVRPQPPAAPPTPPAPPAAAPAPPAAAPVEQPAVTQPLGEDLSEEQMAVLRLVEEGRLTAEEAGALLDALEE